MDTDEKADLATNKIFPLGWGLVFRAVCAPKSLTGAEVADQVTQTDPPGTSNNEWVLSDPEEREKDFDGINKLQCPDCDDRWHWLLNC